MIGFDLETHLITPGNLTPRPVVLSRAKPAELLLPDDGVRWMHEALASGESLATANGYFDAGVLCNYAPDLYPPVFRAYAEGRIRDVQTHEKLKDIARGQLTYDGYSLAALESKYLGRDRSEEKESPDAWRLRYHELDGVPLDQWPADATRYALEDAEGTLRVAQAQGAPLAGESLVTRSNWALHLMSARGMVTEPSRVAATKARLIETKARSFDALCAAGLYRVTGSKEAIAEGRGEWTKDTKRIQSLVLAAYGGNPPLTDTGRVSTDRDTLERSGDLTLAALADVGFVDKLLTTYIPLLERGVVNPRYDIAESIRTTCSGPNIQNLPRKGGIRECFVPRPGFLFVSVDFDTLELRALAQVCLNLFGRSAMAEAIRAGKDLHLDLAAQIIGITYDEALRRKKDPDVKGARQFGKIGNFGLPGGLGVTTLREFARTSYGTELSDAKARWLKATWLRAWPEMRLYFDFMSSLTERTDRMKCFGEGMVRGGVSFTSACNTAFQNLAAQGAREACFAVSEECYVDKGTALYGSRPVAFVHDEILAEVPTDWAHEASVRLSEVMCSAMGKYIPDLPITASPALMTHWYKDAEPVWKDGRLQCWEPSTLTQAH